MKNTPKDILFYAERHQEELDSIAVIDKMMRSRCMWFRDIGKIHLPIPEFEQDYKSLTGKEGNRWLLERTLDNHYKDWEWHLEETDDWGTKYTCYVLTAKKKEESHVG